MSLLFFIMYVQALPGQIVPLPAGSEVNLGSFSLVVPENIQMVEEKDAAAALQRSKAEQIPYCAGILSPVEKGGSYIGFIQLYRNQPHSISQAVPLDLFSQFFKKNHLFYQTPVKGPVEELLPPYTDPGQGTFEIGMAYQDRPSMGQVFFKKIWVGANDTLVMSIKVQDMEKYQTHEQDIQALLQSVATIKPAVEQRPDLPNYAALLGIKITSSLPKEPEIPRNIWVASLVLLTFGVGVLVFAKRQRQKSKGDTGTGTEK